MVVQSRLFPLSPKGLYVTIGTGRTAPKQFIDEIGRRGDCDITSEARALIERGGLTLARHRENTKLIFVTLEELGVSPEAGAGEVYSAARYLGLRPCSTESVLELLIQRGALYVTSMRGSYRLWFSIDLFGSDPMSVQWRDSVLVVTYDPVATNTELSVRYLPSSEEERHPDPERLEDDVWVFEYIPQ